jgi:hypothetical protein
LAVLEMDNTSSLLPYVSFVVAARNDGYGGNFLHRMQVFVNALLALWDKEGLNGELVIVEWNPPGDRPRLQDSLVWPERMQPGTVQIIEVPGEIHHRLPNADRIHLFEYTAKNVGIRRAQGQYVLATNPDLLFSEQLIRFLATNRLSSGCFYRADRYDVTTTVPSMDVEKQLAFCARHFSRVNVRGGSIELSHRPVGLGRISLALQLCVHRYGSYRRRKLRLEDQLHTNTAGDFFLMQRDHWFSLHGYPEMPTSSHIDGYMCAMASSVGLRQILLPSHMRSYHQEHERAVDWKNTQASSRPITKYLLWLEECKEMLRLRRPKVFNNEDWGLAQENLSVYRPTRVQMLKATSMGENRPKISIVATSRNDDHGGNLLHRMQLFLSGLLSQCERHDLNAELILVEWNPPVDRPRLAEALSWPAKPGACCVRIIEVPPEIHGRFKHADNLPLFQMIAKNAGIRRAQGRFVLATNIDILFSDELLRFLVSNRLDKGRMYRIDRHDVPANVPLDVPIDEQLDFCRKNTFRVCLRKGILNVTTGEYHRIYSQVPIPARLHQLLAQLPPKVKELPIIWDHFFYYTERTRLHTNACGDFTLMAKDVWSRLRGYPELEMFSFHLDSLLCYMAHHAGIREAVLPYPAFHIDHSAGWTPEVERDQSLNKRLSEAQIPRITNEQLDDWAVQMRREKKPIIFNDVNWGMAEENLPETTICGTVNPR